MKKVISMLVAILAFSAFGIDANTVHDDIPGTATIGEIVRAGGGGGGGVDTNAVKDIVLDTLATNGIRSVDGAARTLPKYLHALDFDDSYADDAAFYYASLGSGKIDGGCSAVREDNFLYRNFDYPFDERAEFVVKMSAGAGRFASIGVAQVGTNLTEQMVTSGKPSRWYKCLPGATVDGINENGVVVEVNVMDGDPPRLLGGDIHPIAAVRWALDNGTSAEMVASNIAARIMWPVGWKQNLHWMVADKDATYIVENGTAYPLYWYRVAMTNFRLYPTHSSAEGQERYTALMGGANITSQWWTLTYTAAGYRASDLPGITGEELTQLFNYWNNNLRETHRGEKFGDVSWWQTVHTSVYDITNRTLRIAVQETDDWYVFELPSEAVLRTVKPEIAKAMNAVPRIVMGYDEMWADGTMKIHEGLTPWTPGEYVVEFQEKWDNIVWTDNYGQGYQWICSHWQWDNETYSWVFDITGPMDGDNANPNATELKFLGGGGVTRRTPIVRDTKAAAEDAVKADVVAVAKASTNYTDAAIVTATNGFIRAESDPTVPAWAKQPTSPVPAGIVTTNSEGIVEADKFWFRSYASGFQTIKYSFQSASYGADAHLFCIGSMWYDEQDLVYVDLDLNGEYHAPHIFLRDAFTNGGMFSDLPAEITIGDGSSVQPVVNVRADINNIKSAVGFITNDLISASNETFSNAVLAVGLNIDTNAVAVLNEIAATFGDFPIEGTATTVGGLLAALAAAIAWLKKNKADKGELRYGIASSAVTVQAQDRTVTKVTLATTSVTVTFPDATDGKTRDFLLRIDAANLATGGALTITKPTGATIYGDAFPSPEATKQYLVAITETAANEFYCRTIEITTPTEG